MYFKLTCSFAADYSASKHALMGLHESLRAELQYRCAASFLSATERPHFSTHVLIILQLQRSTHPHHPRHPWPSSYSALRFGQAHLSSCLLHRAHRRASHGCQGHHRCSRHASEPYHSFALLLELGVGDEGDADLGERWLGLGEFGPRFIAAELTVCVYSSLEPTRR